VLGERSWLYSSYAFLHYQSQRPSGVRIGHDSGLYMGTFLDLGPRGEVEIGNFCTLAGPIIAANSRVLIGDYALVSFKVVIADSFAAVPAEDDGELTMDTTDATSDPPTTIVVGENVWVGARAVLLPGTRIGDGAIIGASAVVDFEVPPYAIVAGNPARVVSWVRAAHQP
jgi:acetyltransferase-like isoleucine patch superfamily enzyme